MKYQKTRVKCSDEIIVELCRLKECVVEAHQLDAKTAIYLLDFIDELIEGVAERMANARAFEILEEDGTIYEETWVTVPKIIWDYLKTCLSGKDEEFSEVEMFFRSIIDMSEEEFVR